MKNLNRVMKNINHVMKLIISWHEFHDILNIFHDMQNLSTVSNFWLHDFFDFSQKYAPMWAIEVKNDKQFVERLGFQ